jgi:hypothetical protein
VDLFEDAMDADATDDEATEELDEDLEDLLRDLEAPPEGCVAASTSSNASTLIFICDKADSCNCFFISPLLDLTDDEDFDFLGDDRDGSSFIAVVPVNDRSSPRLCFDDRDFLGADRDGSSSKGIDTSSPRICLTADDDRLFFGADLDGIVKSS